MFKHEESNVFVEKLMNYLDFAVPLYRKEGKAELVVGIGCTGGKHRSVAIASLLKDYYLNNGYKAKVYHRDIKKDKN